MLWQLVYVIIWVQQFCTSLAVSQFTTAEEWRKRHDAKLCGHSSCCRITSSERCALSQLPPDQATLIFPGGSTRCIFSNSGSYKFEVLPGDKDKLLIYFQGGGGCFDERSSRSGLCVPNALPDGAMEVLRSDTYPDDRIKAYTVVTVLYCSGDLHLGDTQREYPDEHGMPIEQRGLVNTGAVLSWIQEQQTMGELANEFTSLLLVGSSAGSMAVQAWAHSLLAQFNWQRAAVVADSYVGVFPDGALANILTDINLCSAPFMSASKMPQHNSDCLSRKLEFSDLFVSVAKKNPDVPYAFMLSKADTTQMKFYEEVGKAGGYADSDINPAQFYEKMNRYLTTYSANLENFVVYLVNGQNHVFLKPTLLTADAVGPKNQGKNFDGEMLLPWFAQFPLLEGEQTSSVCAGPIEHDSRRLLRTRGLEATAAGDSREVPNYCVESVASHKFNEHYTLH